MIKLINVSKEFKSKNRKILALNNVNISFDKTGFTLITGESGGGKTTLLNIISMTLQPTSGEILLNGMQSQLSASQSADFRSHNIGFIFQDYNLISDLTILDNIKLALSLQNKTLEEIEIVQKLNSVGLDNVIKAYPNELSGGQKQRVAIVRALLLDYDVILADEPTGALDERNSKEIFKIFKDIAKDKLVIVVSHNISLAREYADRIIELKDGQVVKDETINEGYVIKKEFDFTNRKVGNKFLGLLGIKYLKLKSIKTYFSLLMLVITFTLLFVSLSLMGFSKDSAYEKGLQTENIHFSVIEKRKVIDGSPSYSEISLEDKAYIEENFDNYCTMYSYAERMTLLDDSNYLDTRMFSTINIENIEKFGFTLNGSLPNNKELLLTTYQADYLNINVENYKYKKIEIKSQEYSISGIIDFNIESSSIDNVVFINENMINQDWFFADYIELMVTDASSYENIDNVLSHLNSIDSNYQFFIDNLVYESVVRIQVFGKVLFEAGIVISIIFIVLSFLTLVNIVSNSITEKKSDIMVLKKLGCKTKNIFYIFVIQPLLIVFTSIVISICLCFTVQGFLNQYIRQEFYFLIDLFNMNFLNLFLNFCIITIIVIFSTFIPLKRIKTN